jgi:hypothetical protein
LGEDSLSPKLKLILEAMTDFDVVVRRHCQIAPVNQSVNILPEQKPVGWAVRASQRVGSDMGGIQHMKNVGIRDRALALVHVGDNDPECALTQASQNRLRLTEAGATRNNDKLSCPTHRAASFKSMRRTNSNIVIFNPNLFRAKSAIAFAPGCPCLLPAQVSR